MTTRGEAMVRAALSQLGVTEDPPGSNMQPFAPAVGDANGFAWCCSFVHWAAQEAGIAFPSTAYVPSLEQWARDAVCTVPPDQIRRGDVICLDFTAPFGDGSDHVEIATGPPENGTVPAVGGNTSDRSGGSVDNGGGVFANVRPLAWVATAIRLPGSDEIIDGPDPQPDEEDTMSLTIIQPTTRPVAFQGRPVLDLWMVPSGAIGSTRIDSTLVIMPVDPADAADPAKPLKVDVHQVGTGASVQQITVPAAGLMVPITIGGRVAVVGDPARPVLVHGREVHYS